jgi:hypothetical protein
MSVPSTQPAAGETAALSAFLAALQSEHVPAPVVATYYDSPLIRELYPETEWRWERVCVTKNSALRQGNKPRTEEIILTKRTATKETP